MIRSTAGIRGEFSPHTRGYNLARLRAELFDILIVGGGFTGATIALEAARRGFKVALVEKDDFGAGSTYFKPLPGGVRYLDGFQMHSGLSAVRARDQFVRNAPSRAWRLPTVYPVYSNSPSSPKAVNLGIGARQAFSFFQSVEPYRMLTPGEVAADFPRFDLKPIAGAVLFDEVFVDESRIILDTLRAAHTAGAVIVNHSEVVDLLRSAGKRLDGVCALDKVSKDYVNARARVVVNATGAASETLSALDTPGIEQSVWANKVVYLLLPYSRLPAPHAMVFRFREDGNWMYILPRPPNTLVGPLELELSGTLIEPTVTRSEVDYMLRAVAVEFPRQPPRRDDVISAYVGLRPLIASGGNLKPGPKAWQAPGGLQNVIGGEIAMQPQLAVQFVDRAVGLLDYFGVRPAHPSRRGPTVLTEAVSEQEGMRRALSEAMASLPPATLSYLRKLYGPRLPQVLEYVRADQKLGAPIVNGFPFIWAQVPHSVEFEMAVTIADVMVRRLDLFHLVSDSAVGAAQDVARYMSSLLDWVDPDIELQVDEYSELARKSRFGLGRSDG